MPDAAGMVASPGGERVQASVRVEIGVSAGYALRCGPTSGETRGEGAEPARGRCGGKRAPLGELVVDEQRAGMSSVTRPACRDGSN